MIRDPGENCPIQRSLLPFCFLRTQLHHDYLSQASQLCPRAVDLFEHSLGQFAAFHSRGAFRVVMKVSRDASRGFFVLAQTRLQAGGSCGSLRENPSGVDPHVIIAMLHVEQSFREPLRHWSDWSNGTSCSGRARPAWMGAEERKAVSARMTRYWPAWRARSEIPKMATPLHLGGWECLTPISDEEAAHSNVCCGRRSESRFDAEV